MKRLPPHSNTTYLVIITLAAIGFFVGRSSFLISAAQTNLDFVDASRTLLIAEKSSRDRVEGLDLKTPCGNYAHVVAYLTQSGLSAGEKIQAIATLVPCWDSGRQQLLGPVKAESLWELGRHTEACDLLQHLQAGDQTVRLLKKSFDQQDFAAVESYLACLPAFKGKPVWISPYIVAAVYYGLGQYYEEQGNLERAMTDYEQAATLYPVVWAAPYIARAHLLWNQGEHDRAIQTLLTPLPASTDATATYNLWYELGSLWKQEGVLPSALCAYQKAEAISAGVPPANLTQEMRITLRETIDRLHSAGVQPNCSDISTLVH